MDIININDYDYHLPEHLIAKEPLAQRDASRLLVYNNQQVGHRKFTDCAELLPDSNTIVFNNSSVLSARLYFKKEQGAQIEVLPIKPQAPAQMSHALQATGQVTFNCIVGNKKKWHAGQTISITPTVTAQWANREQNHVTFNYPSHNTFAQILEQYGEIPLPPYLNRKPTANDTIRYQTVYNNIKGSVAAPTAGLHFTKQVLKELKDKGHQIAYLTLHVGAGTFLPVKVENALEHPMHSETFFISTELLDQLQQTQYITAVGTTSVRSLESLPIVAAQLKHNLPHPFVVKKLSYQKLDLPNRTETIKILKNHLKSTSATIIEAQTELMIVPGFSFRLTDIMFTNFHQPKSTLLLLVSAFIGQNWTTVYAEAVKNQYRMLSYGDSSLLYNC